jgi:hypothetical protein
MTKKHERGEKCIQKYVWTFSRDFAHFAVLGTDGKTVLKWILEK